MAKKYQIVGEDQHAFTLHDGESEFKVAKSAIAQHTMQHIRGMPKFGKGKAFGGEIEEGGDSEPVAETPSPSFGDQINNFVNSTNSAANDASAKGVEAQQAQEAPGSAFAGAGTPPDPDAVPAVEAAPASATPEVPAEQRAPAATSIPGMDPGSMMKNLDRSYNATASAVRKGAQAEADMSKEQAGIYGKLYSPEEEAATHKRLTELQANEKQMDADNHKLGEEVMAGKVDPNRIWKNTSTGNKVLAAIGILFSGAGSGGNSANNAALNIINKAIDHDIDAQKTDLDNKKSLYQMNLQKYRDNGVAMQATRMQLNAVAQAKIMAVASKFQGPIAQAKAEAMLAPLKMQYDQAKMGVMQAQAKMALANDKTLEPAKKIALVVPEKHQAAAYKELQSAQNLTHLRNRGLEVFDDLGKMNTIGNTLNPQARSKIAAEKDAFLDQLTKDTSGRVTPETVKLVGGLFPERGDNEQTLREKRQNMHKFLLEKSSFPLLDAYNMNPAKAIVYSEPAKNVPRRN